MSCEEEEGEGGGRKIPMQKKKNSNKDRRSSRGKTSSTLELIENQFQIFIPSWLDLEPEL